MNTKIEETRAYFIEKYGEPQEKVIDGKTYKKINVALSNYDELLKSFHLISKKYNIKLKNCHIEILSDFAKTEVSANIDNVNRKLKFIIKKENNLGMKVAFLKFLEESERYYLSEKYDPRRIMQIFQDELNIQNFNQYFNYKILI